MTRLRWNGPTDLEICIMSARSARRTRRRRWRMGRDRAGEREMRRTHGRRVVAKHLSSRGGSVAFCFSHPRTSSFIRTPKCFPPCCFPSTFRFHGPHRVWIRFGNFLPLLMPTAGWKIRTAAAAAGQTITRTTDEANLFIPRGQCLVFLFFVSPTFGFSSSAARRRKPWERG